MCWRVLWRTWKSFEAWLLEEEEKKARGRAELRSGVELRQRRAAVLRGVDIVEVAGEVLGELRPQRSNGRFLLFWSSDSQL